MGTQKSSNFNCFKMSDSESNDEIPQLLPDNIVLRDWQKRVVNWAMSPREQRLQDLQFNFIKKVLNIYYNFISSKVVL